MKLQSLNTQSNVNFQSKNKNIEGASAFVNMNDDQIKDMAYIMSYEQRRHQKKHNNNSLNSMFYAIPVVDTIASAILVSKSQFAQKHCINLRNHDRLQSPSDVESLFHNLQNANLKNRMKAAGSTAKGWVLALGVIGVYNLAKKAIVSHSESMQHFQKDNPVASFIVDMGVIIAGFVAGAKGLARLENKFPKTVKEFDTKSNKILSKLNKTKLNTKALPKMIEGFEKFSERMPRVANATRFALRNSVWILFGLGLVQMGRHQNKERKKIEKGFKKDVKRNYKELKKAQFETAKHLSNVLAVEKSVLAQSQPKLANELNNEMDKTAAISEE